MVQGSKLTTLLQFNGMIQHARNGRDIFVDELSNFLVQEFGLHALAIFKLEGQKLALLGKSSGVKKSFQTGGSYSSENCVEINPTEEFSIIDNSDCLLNISDVSAYEASVSFRVDLTTNVVVRVAKQNPFSPNENDAIKILGQYIKNLLLIWLNARGGIVTSENNIFNLVQSSTVEFRSIVNAIVGSCSILGDESISPAQASYIETIKENAHRLLITINEFNEIMKYQKGNVQIKDTDVNLKEVIKETIDVLNGKLSHQNISFHFTPDESLPSKISLDQAKFKFFINQFLTVLSQIVNVGKIEIEGKVDQNHFIQFKIKDSAKASFMNLTPKILEPFGIQHFVDISKLSISGLSFVYLSTIIEKLGGRLGFVEDHEEGNYFAITLIPKFSSGVQNQLSSLPQPTSDLNTILVIEDDYATSKLLSNYLVKWGYEPTIVNNEEKTFELLDKEKFLAVILDIELPEGNGMELLRKIKQHPNMKGTPVIVCSVEVEEQKAFMMGAMEYFSKPINYNHLVEVLTSYKLHKNSTVLCVDDDVPTLNLVAQAVSTAGFKPLPEHISANVMDLIHDKDIDLAIIDLDMPHPNGFELIKLIKSEDKFKNLPIIIYTGKENFGEDLEEIDGLFDELLSKKSTNIEDLADTIKQMISRYEEPKTVEEIIKDTTDDDVRILFAEDYKHSQIIVTRLLKKNGFENIAVVENGEEALKLAEKERFDIILMDMQMPIMNGFEAIEKIRQIPEYQDTPIISLTAFAMKGDREKCLDAGATDYIPKPIDSKEFIEKIKYYARLKNKR